VGAAEDRPGLTAAPRGRRRRTAARAVGRSAIGALARFVM
jgi:hypothetical protein